MSSQDGTIFDIKEFATHDGPGIRMTIFLKGCPLSCAWCHNPEGISPDPQVMTSPVGERLVGQRISAEELAERIMAQADVLRNANGGVTFSGGEPAQQAEFIEAVLDRIRGVHTLLDTSGYASPAAFARLIRRFDLVHYDVKLVDPKEHEKYCGVSNGLLLDNLEQLKKSAVPFCIRVPLVPGVTDTIQNMKGIADLAKSATNLIRVELLGYNKVAGGKYSLLGKIFTPLWNEDANVQYHEDIFVDLDIEVKAL